MEKTKFLIAIITLLFVSFSSNATQMEIDGIYYNILSDSTLEVGYKIVYGTENPYNWYKGDVVIPEQVIVGSKKYKVTKIGKHAFSKCSDLTSVSIPNSVFTIGNWAFDESPKLESAYVPKSVTNLGSGVFARCTGLKKIILENEEISFEMFFNCTSLDSIAIPKNIKKIGKQAFYNCSGLKYIEIHDNIDTIPEEMCYGCTALQKVIIGKNVKFIGERALMNNSTYDESTSLTQVYSRMEDPAIIDSNVFSCYDYCTLYVPKGSLDYYKDDMVWSKFRKIREYDYNFKPSVIGDLNGDGVVNTTDLESLMKIILSNAE